MGKPMVISGIGCCLADYLYTPVDFSSPGFQKYRSEKDGDGGLSPGKLVFTEELESFAGTSYPTILKDITGEASPYFNIGGPSIVSLINAAQLLCHEDVEVRFYGTASDDETGRNIISVLRDLPVNIDQYTHNSHKPSPFTDVFSDPDFHEGQGERTFVNNIGSAWDSRPENIDPSFYDSEFTCFGGTALVPNIHDNLHRMLVQSKSRDCFTLVNTVYDFRNEKARPHKKWPLGDNEASFPYVDLLIADREEAYKISGFRDTGKAIQYFKDKGLGAVIITNGAHDVHYFAEGSRFIPAAHSSLPVSEEVVAELQQYPEKKGDTTGCGDNFAGAVLASLVWQKIRNPGLPYNLELAISWGVVGGGFACFYKGGTYYEREKGEKLRYVMHYQDAHAKQVKLG